MKSEIDFQWDHVLSRRRKRIIDPFYPAWGKIVLTHTKKNKIDDEEQNWFISFFYENL